MLRDAVFPAFWLQYSFIKPVDVGCDLPPPVGLERSIVRPSSVTADISVSTGNDVEPSRLQGRADCLHERQRRTLPGGPGSDTSAGSTRQSDQAEMFPITSSMKTPVGTSLLEEVGDARKPRLLVAAAPDVPEVLRPPVARDQRPCSEFLSSQPFAPAPCCRASAGVEAGWDIGTRTCRRATSRAASPRAAHRLSPTITYAYLS